MKNRTIIIVLLFILNIFSLSAQCKGDVNMDTFIDIIDALKTARYYVGLITRFPCDESIVTVPGDYPTIQAAIVAADNGSTILLAGGVYQGTGNKNLQWDGTIKHLTIKSENGSENCIIDCEEENGDFHLLSNSPAIDSGDLQAIQFFNQGDLDGDNRVSGRNYYVTYFFLYFSIFTLTPPNIAIPFIRIVGAFG